MIPKAKPKAQKTPTIAFCTLKMMSKMSAAVTVAAFSAKGPKARILIVVDSDAPEADKLTGYLSALPLSMA